MFEKPENTVDVSKYLVNLSSFAARVCKSFTWLPRLEEIGLSSLLQNANCCLTGKKFTFNEVFQNHSIFPYLCIVNADIYQLIYITKYN